MQNMSGGKSALGLDGNITALLGYIIWVVALVALLIEKDNRFVRFHAVQSLIYTAAIVVVAIVLSIFTTILAFISGTLAGLFSLVFMLLWLGALVGIIILAIKAFQGQMFKLPVVGDMAEKWA